MLSNRSVLWNGTPLEREHENALFDKMSLPLQGYREDDGLYLESDTDDQLLIHVPFRTGEYVTRQSKEEIY